MADNSPTNSAAKQNQPTTSDGNQQGVPWEVLIDFLNKLTHERDSEKIEEAYLDAKQRIKEIRETNQETCVTESSNGIPEKELKTSDKFVTNKPCSEFNLVNVEVNVSEKSEDFTDETGLILYLSENNVLVLDGRNANTQTIVRESLPVSERNNESIGSETNEGVISTIIHKSKITKLTDLNENWFGSVIDLNEVMSYNLNLDYSCVANHYAFTQRSMMLNRMCYTVWDEWNLRFNAEIQSDDMIPARSLCRPTDLNQFVKQYLSKYCCSNDERRILLSHNFTFQHFERNKDDFIRNNSIFFRHHSNHFMLEFERICEVRIPTDDSQIKFESASRSAGVQVHKDPFTSSLLLAPSTDVLHPASADIESDNRQNYHIVDRTSSKKVLQKSSNIFVQAAYNFKVKIVRLTLILQAAWFAQLVSFLITMLAPSVNSGRHTRQSPERSGSALTELAPMIQIRMMIVDHGKEYSTTKICLLSAHYFVFLDDIEDTALKEGSSEFRKIPETILVRSDLSARLKYARPCYLQAYMEFVWNIQLYPSAISKLCHQVSCIIYQWGHYALGIVNHHLRPT